MTLHKETLKECLEKMAKEREYEDCQITIEAISSDGANYTSILYLATLKAPGKEDLEMFAKVAAVGEKMRENVPFRIYENESLFYKTLLNKYKQLEDKNNIPAEHRFKTPIFYGGSDEYLKETLILEDLTKKGFTTHDRFQSIDWEYASKCLETLAKFHALSIAYSVDDPEGFEDFSVLNGSRNISITNYLSSVVTNALKVIKEDNRERLSKLTDGLKENRDFEKFFKPRRRRVIIHGDYRPSNMMHRVVDGKMEIITVDYQTLKIGNPIIDIMYYIFNGSDKKFRDMHFQASLDLYYMELCKALKRFGLNPEELYSREDFDLELKEILPVGLILSMFCLLIVTVEKKDAPKVSEDISLEDFAINPNNLYTERLNDIVEDYIRMGVI